MAVTDARLISGMLSILRQVSSMTYEEIMTQCEILYMQERENIYMAWEENYEWKLGYAVVGRINEGLGFRGGKIPGRILSFMGIPAQIDYLRPECLELWKKVG